MFIQKDLTGKCWKGGNSREYIIVHHSGSSRDTTFEQLLRFFRLSELVSCHYVVGKQGEITQMVDEKDRAWHAGKSYWKGQTDLNNCSIGIEILSDGKDFTNSQREAVKWLCKDIMKRNKIPPHHVLRHKDVSPNRKWDVADSFFNPYFGSTWSSFQMALIRK